MTIKLGKYTHFKGLDYEVIGTATDSETLVPMVIYRALSKNGGLWVRPVSMWEDLVQYKGRTMKRFTHEGEMATSSTENDTPGTTANVPEPISATTGQSVNKYSPPREKIKLFLSLFKGRGDIYAKRWENQKGGHGYSPACSNEWEPNCSKKRRNGIKCRECPNRKLIEFNDVAIVRHLKGHHTIGSYPMNTDDTCSFLAFDFDKQDYTPDELKRDAGTFRQAFVEKNISVAVERSRSGNGVHFWVFFSENIPANIARKFGSSMITFAMSKNHHIRFKTYDRMFPGQDTMPDGGFGNLIALPLQKNPLKEGNSAFIDEHFQAYPDQWSYLSSIKKYTLKEIEQFARELSPDGALGILHQTLDDEKPWEIKKSAPKLTRFDFPSSVRIVDANMLYIRKEGISNQALNTLKRLAAFSNPKFYKNQAIRLSNHATPRIISCSEETEQYLLLPRGLKESVKQILDDNNVRSEWIDELNRGFPIDAEFTGELLDKQLQAANALLSYNNGVLSAATAFGKTVIGAYLIAKKKVNTLILVHRTNIQSQWIERLTEFLSINEEPMIEYTPKGRIRNKSIVGQIGGGKTNQSGIIDVALVDSLSSKEEVKEFVKGYGMVIVDECHRVAAFNFERVLKSANAAFVYGMTATPIRQDGHHPIIFMQCGNIRYRVDAKAQAAERPFDHFILPRFTRFNRPFYNEATKWNIMSIRKDIQENDSRNDLIVRDVLTAVQQGRNPIVITELKDHVSILENKLTPYIKNVISMTGGTSHKTSREILHSVTAIPSDEQFVLVATGQYIGEGFDMPRLDTLFLTMPISWKGKVQQYAGRLHRLYEGKKEVHIYDYVDIRDARLEKMYQERLKGYASMGYKVKGTPQPIEEVHSIFDNKNFSPVYTADVLGAEKSVLIVSPFLGIRRVALALKYLNTTTCQSTIVTRPPDDYVEKDRVRIKTCIETLEEHGVNVMTKERIHQKFAIIDRRIVWYGSINLLSYGASEESIMRLDSVDIAAELEETLR